MKLNKVISAVSAFAVAVSMFSAFTVANAASLGGNPSVTATFDSYEKVSDSVAFAYVNLTIDMTAAEDLLAYSNELDEETWEEVIKGNGISTMGLAWSNPEGFTYTKAKSTIPDGLTVNTAGTNLAFGPQTNAENYLVTPVTTVKLALRVNDFDAKGNVEISNATVDGKNSEESAVWSYSLLGGTIDVTGCSIPSYNEWSTPETTEYEVTFKADGVQVGEVIKVAENGTVAELPEAPAKEGFTFSKWVIEGTETEFTTETPVTADITVVAVYTEDEKPASVELGTIEKGGDMYGQNTAVTSMSFANVAAPKVKISLDAESKEYELPSGIVGGTTRLIGIVRYQKGTTGTFTITVLDGAEELASDTFEAVAE